MDMERLLTAWRKAPSEALRELILAHDDQNPLEALRDLESLTTSELTLRLKAWSTKPKDPRLSRALQALLQNVKWSSDSSKPMWRTVFELTKKSGDPRLKSFNPEFKVRTSMQAWLRKQYDEATAGLPGQFEPSDEAPWEKALASLKPKKVKLGAVSEASLLEAIYANPGDDGPRRVLADLLIEAGDPRGEFIMLQCTGADPKRARALLKANEKAWLSPFEGTLREVKWSRGFPSEGLVRFKAQQDAERVGLKPNWATLEVLEWAARDTAASSQWKWIHFIGPSFRFLRRADAPWFEQLVEGRIHFSQLEELRGIWLDEPELLLRFVKVAPSCCPKLRRLQLKSRTGSRDEILTVLRQVPTLGSIKQLDLYNAEPTAAFVQAVERLAIDVLCFEGVGADGEQLTFTRNARGKLAVSKA